MSKFIRPDIRVKPTLGVSPRPLPRSLIDTYYQSEAEFRKFIERLESDPTFRDLVDKGIVRKVHFKGRVPQHRYEETKDEEMVHFFKKYNIARQPDWEHDFLNRAAIGRKHEIAKKYGVPVGELLSVLRYTAFLTTMRDTLPEVSVTSTSEDDADFLRFTPSESVFDTGPVAEELARFVQRYGVARETFVECFLGLDFDEEAILGKIPCSRPEIARVRALVEKLQVLNSFCVEAVGARQPSAGRHREKFGPIAEFRRVGDTLDVKINLMDDTVYAAKYRITTEADAGEGELTKAQSDFLNQLRAVNQRKNVLHRLIAFLFKYQYKYLLTGNPLDLFPLSQAAAAKAIFEEEATVSRLIRDKTIVTPCGVVPMKFFFHKVSKVVENLVLLRESQEIARKARSRPYTDVEIRELLKRVYHVDLSRRSITYHRNRCLTRSNYYTRVRKARDKGGSDRPPDRPAR
ncbi:MAG: hypothetical protein HY815_13320 [Candidatus Riflebacteria bacterium]|nr:hypothetical protein [Candidatus Riflebacteria bacterium]